MSPAAGLLVDLVAAVGAVPEGGTVAVTVGPGDVATVRRWCELTGNTLISAEKRRAEIRRGRLPDPVAALPVERRPGYRLWLYSNFDCNLACDYCCVSSSPRAPRRPLGLDVVRRLVAEGAAAGVGEVCVTGGEPMLLPDIAAQLEACTDRLPTTLLTNGSLLRGERLAALAALPRDRLAIQVSVDSARPERHDRHRGRGSHARALAGARAALAAGLRVRLAATLAAEDRDDEVGLHVLAAELGISPADRVIRRMALQGEAERGLVLTRRTLLPEVCVTADGVYWHPVAATDPSMLVSVRLFPLAAAIAQVREEFAAHRRRDGDLAMTFPCA